MGFIPEPVNGLAGYFTGQWQFSRKIIDAKSGHEAHVEGMAHFCGDQNILDYAETGSMDFGDYHGEVTQNYIYEFTGLFKANVRFPDQRLFHELDLKTGQTSPSHWCDPDQYDGHYHLLDQAKWLLEWKISGPRKDAIISTLYHR